jgi:monoamine oxidase
MPSNNRTVTIIGAGLAGLSAAFDLHRAGWQVTVLEARERVGGRVFSVRNFSNGLVAEGGGEFIDQHHIRMLAFVREFNLSLGEVGSWRGQTEDWGAYEGQAGLGHDSKVWGFDLDHEDEKVWSALAELGKQVPDPMRPELAPNAKELDNRSSADWIGALDVHPLARRVFADHIRSEYTCEPERFSLLDLARNAAMYYSDPSLRKSTYRVIGGNDQIARRIADVLPDIRMNAVVTSVSDHPDGVSVTYRHGGTFHTVSSAFTILAIPLTTARLIEFNPPLPPAHARMVNEISYGAITKVLIEYRRRFWQDQGWNGRLSTDQSIVQTWEATSHLPGEHGILTAYTGGEPGAIFPGSSDLIENTATVAWNNEPFTRASYMALAPGEVLRHWQTLFEPAGRLFFAGEHATVIQGFMEGAVESGQRAAANIISS